jgi:hypothetical protein
MVGNEVSLLKNIILCFLAPVCVFKSLLVGLVMKLCIFAFCVLCTTCVLKNIYMPPTQHFHPIAVSFFCSCMYSVLLL